MPGKPYQMNGETKYKEFLYFPSSSLHWKYYIALEKAVLDFVENDIKKKADEQGCYQHGTRQSSDNHHAFNTAVKQGGLCYGLI